MIVFTTLAENKYFYGVAALINSIIKNGTYADKIVVGYRGALPLWLPILTNSKNGKALTLKNGFIIDFVELEGDLHMVHEKPKWFYHLSHVLEPEASEYFFFDSDIILINRMSFFGEWIRQGVAICEDINYDMSSNHPIRKQWIELAKYNNYVINDIPSRYYNSGFLGWTKETIPFISDWNNCSKILMEVAGDLKQFRVNDRTNVVLSANQDSLNMAVMITNSGVSTIGPEAMGFNYGLPLMLHPLGPKPWDINFLINFFKGKPPRHADIEFWKNVNSNELKPYKTLYVKRKIFFIKTFKVLSRFYSKQNN
jgi:hypothetical protein